MNLLAFDLDHTLFFTERGIDWSSPASVRRRSRPNQLVIDLVRQLALGSRIAVVTGRCRDAGLEDVTERQLEQARLYPDELHLQPEWTDDEAMRDWKATVLEGLGADLYVGDHPADRAAAEEADVDFLHARVLWRMAGVQVVDHADFGTVEAVL